MVSSVKLEYIEDANVSEESYLHFLESQYEHRAQCKHGVRREWYKKRSGYKILLALENGHILGQSCAYKDIAIIHGEETEIWWGVDVFVLPEARGKGVGKLMQQKFHRELPNFCSAWYSPVNGIVKRKCGSKELFSVSFCYYPVSSYFTYMGNLILKKVLKRNISLKFPIPYLYTSLNRRRYKDYSFQEVALDARAFEFISDSSLSSFDFYVKRDSKYLKWRYMENPNLKYHVIEISKDNKAEAIAIFTEVHFEEAFYISKVMDVFKKCGSVLKEKDILCFIAKYFKSQNVKIDGLMHLTECNYYPRFVRNTKFLSTIGIDKNVMRPYISYSDQDMVQMY